MDFRASSKNCLDQTNPDTKFPYDTCPPHYYIIRGANILLSSLSSIPVNFALLHITRSALVNSQRIQLEMKRSHLRNAPTNTAVQDDMRFPLFCS